FLRFVPRDWRYMTSPYVRPLILMGQNSLPIFCLGVFLSFAAHWFLAQVDGDVFAQIVVSFAGMLTMAVVAWGLSKFKELPDHFAPPQTSVPETSVPAPFARGTSAPPAAE
ncbi:OpgC domain-containing protein, partial [Staphylococcus sp. EG-SA-29]|uniref:OpgC domain-containing protein n=1 Tax=Staphylococcus sp. EG-SA-29 TaxID=2767500 RepID=UPI001981F5DB